MLKLNEEIIPNGPYCYDENGYCPYFTHLQFWNKMQISVPYCVYLQQGGMPNGMMTDEEFENLLELLHQTEDEIWDYEFGLLGLPLLWDQCKECGINCEYKEGK